MRVYLLYKFNLLHFSLVIERVQTTLRFPHSHRINKLPMPERSSKPSSRIQSRVIDTAADDKPTVVVN